MREVESKYLLTKEQYEKIREDHQFVEQKYMTNHYYQTNSPDTLRLREESRKKDMELTYKRRLKQEGSVVESLEITEAWITDYAPDSISHKELPTSIIEYLEESPSYQKEGCIRIARKVYILDNLQVEFDIVELDLGVFFYELEMESFNPRDHNHLRELLREDYNITEASTKPKYQRFREHLEREAR